MRRIVLSAVLAIVCSAAVAADSAVPNRLPQAKAGEWVLMVDITGENAGEKMKVSVVEVREGTPKVVVLRRDRIAADGTSTQEGVLELNLDRYAERMAGLEEKAKQVSRERLTIKDREFTVQAISWDGDTPDADGKPREFKMWLTEELPIGGMAKFWSSDPEVPSIEVIDYGF